MPHAVCRFLRTWLAGAALVLAPLLALEDMDVLVRTTLVSFAFGREWPRQVAIPGSVLFGAVAACLVALRGSADAVARLETLARRVVRHLLFLILSVYALSKVLRTQFRVPYATLDTPLGDVNGYMLAWRFFGYSYGLEIFVALGEWVGPGLLLFWRTATLGACITTMVMANVVVVNFTHGLPVQRFSSCLLALTVYLLFLDRRRLLDFFAFNRPVDPQPAPAPRILSGTRRALFKGAWVALGVAYAFLYIALGDSQATPITGSWRVASSAGKPAGSWQTINFERGFQGAYPGSVRRRDGGKPDGFQYECDIAAQQVRVTFLPRTDASKRFQGTYEFEDDGSLRLRGNLNDQAVDIRLVRKY